MSIAILSMTPLKIIFLKLDHKQDFVTRKNHVFKYVYMYIIFMDLIHINIRDALLYIYIYIN